MGKSIDLTGKQFGRLFVISKAESLKDSSGATRAMWNCKCGCGNIVTVRAATLRNGNTKSCGCLKHERKPRSDIIGEKFGRLTVDSLYGRTPNNKLTYLCTCDCGNTVIAIGAELRNGHTKSCGCYRIDVTSERMTQHGLSNSRIRSVWRGMIARCENPKIDGYKNYGGRGIEVCFEWHDLEVFAKWAYENGYDENAERGECTIDRIDVNGNYEPSNCRFVDMKVQCRNKRNNNVIQIGERKKSVAEWSELTGIDRNTIVYREGHNLPLFEKGRISEENFNKKSRNIQL